MINSAKLLDNIIALINPPKEFTIKIVDKFKSLYVQLTPLQQTLYNIIHNAIQHHDKETGTIEVSIEENETQYIFNIHDDVRWPNLSRLKIRNYEIQFAA